MSNRVKRLKEPWHRAFGLMLSMHPRQSLEAGSECCLVLIIEQEVVVETGMDTSASLAAKFELQF